MFKSLQVLCTPIPRFAFRVLTLVLSLGFIGSLVAADFALTWFSACLFVPAYAMSYGRAYPRWRLSTAFKTLGLLTVGAFPFFMATKELAALYALFLCFVLMLVVIYDCL